MVEGPETATSAKLGTPSVPNETVFKKLENIEELLGATPYPQSAMADYEIQNIDTTYREMKVGDIALSEVSPTTDGTLRGRVFLDDMETGDAVDIQIQAAHSPEDWKVVETYSYSGAQANQVLDLEIRYYNGLGVRTMIRQTSGSPRTFRFIRLS